MFSWFKRKKKDENLAEIKTDAELSPEELTEEDASLTETSHIEVREIGPETLESELELSESKAELPPIEAETSEIETETVNSSIEVVEEEVEAADPNLQVLPQEESEPQEKKPGLFGSLFSGLNKTRKKIGDRIDNLLNSYREIDEELYEEIEDILITADIGMTCTMDLIDRLKDELEKRKIKDAGKVKSVLRDVMADYLKMEEESELASESPTVILVIGVNGAGKTTSIGKLSHKLKSEGKKVVLAAADTFRAAAIDQLKVWAERAEVAFVAHAEGSDPSAVIFDGIKSAQAKNADVLICDTAGRLHNKVNLMNELNKMFRIIEREYPEAKKEVLLVLDATTGQNAVNQAKEFLQSAGITGLVLTKLDGTAKGGFVFAIKSELGIPVKLVGVGEKIEDLQTFDPESYANAILNL